MATIAAGLLAAALLDALGVPESVTGYLNTLPLATLPVAIGIAMFRHRLYDVDRALLASGATALAALVWLAAVSAVGAAAGSVLAALAAGLAAVRDGAPLTRLAADDDNSHEALTAIACGETDNPRDPRVWPGVDRDRYTGPFDRKAGLLVVNARYDAFSSLARARKVADLMGARLVTVEGPGHTMEGTDSACADLAVERYLAGALPAKGAVCAQDSTPF